MMTEREMIKYDEMVMYDIATKEELNLARNLCTGTWDKVLDDVCYVRTGYWTWEQYKKEELGEEEEEEEEEK